MHSIQVSRTGLLLFLLALLCAGCASGPPAAFSTGMRSQTLLDGEPFGIGEQDRLPDPQLLAVDDGMRAFLEQRVVDDATPVTRIRSILRGILDDGLHMEYDNLRTLSAADAFAERSGNCMSFTNLFIALARESGLRVRYQEVMLPPNWSDGGNEGMWIYNLHVNALVDIRSGLSQVVDFSIGDFDSNYPRRVLSDDEGAARYHNNMGVYWMTREEPARAFLHFREAIALAPDTGHLWTNLGTLYRREGHTARAEAAMREAIARGADAVAMSNLARLYRQNDQPELAAYYENAVRAFRRKNPYFLYQQAQEALAAEDATGAKRHIQQAIRRHDGDRRFYDLLARAELQLGNPGAARQALRAAAALSDAPQREAYQHKLELLADR
jgi:Flp pilus assembly protein TadD